MLVAGLLDEVGLPAGLADRVRLEGDERPFATPFEVVEAAASVLAATGAAASLVHEERSGVAQSVRVARGHAAASLVGFAFQHLESGETPVAPWSLDRPFVRLYRCGDGRWVHLHGQFPHLAARTCEVLGCDPSSDAATIAARVGTWEGEVLEEALADAGTCGAMARTAEEWSAHPQWSSIAPLGRVSVEKIGESDPEPFGSAPPAENGRPLGGVRVLDLSRLLAGPTNGRTLAEYGAEVLLVNSPRLANVPAFVMDTSHGKRSCCIELEEVEGVATLRRLASTADVFTQGYRSGSLERRGFGPDALAALRPGIVVVTINCYGDTGPWRLRPGWEQMAQTVSGLAVGQGGVDAPALVPAAACDYTTGYLAALGTMAALWRRAHEGGSYHVRASLCQTAGWFTRLPTQAATGPAASAASDFGDTASYLVRSDTPYGRLTHLAPVARLARTPSRWDVPTSPIGTHLPAWQAAPTSREKI
jgi:crotonobetainyl-CoA:carnitine CoA-transferase CaiB-like acyl-CoA transferase